MSRTVYVIDKDDIIIRVNPAWIAFARENGLPEAREHDYAERSLWDFIQGDSTRHLWKLIFDRVRSTLKTIKLQYRCDSPDRRRNMDMGIIPIPSGEIEMINRVLQEEPRNPIELPNLPANLPSNDFVAICSWCKKIRISETFPEQPELEEWAEIEEAVSRLGLLEKRISPNLSYGVCNACSRAILSGLEDESEEPVIVLSRPGASNVSYSH